MSLRIVALGDDRAAAVEGAEKPAPSLISTYLGRGSLLLDTHPDSSRLLLQDATRPVFTKYEVCLFGSTTLLLHDCPSWELFDSEWCNSLSVVCEADIIVIKYSVNDKSSFQEIRDNYAPMIKRVIDNCTVPVIISAVGVRKHEESLACTCPLCMSDRRRCVTSSEGIQLAKDLGATYLELHSLNDFYVGRYFGGVMEYFMIQSLNQKSSEKMKKKKKVSQCQQLKAPRLDQPEKMPLLKDETSHYAADLMSMLMQCQCMDVAFYTESLEKVEEAHRIVLCCVSYVFRLLFKVKTAADIRDLSIVRTARNLFIVSNEPALPDSSRGPLHNPPECDDTFGMKRMLLHAGGIIRLPEGMAYEVFG